MKEEHWSCPFCCLDDPPNEPIFHGSVFINPGHTLIVSIRHSAKTIFDLTPIEMERLHDALREVKHHLDEEFRPDGYNVGANCGSAAGQTIDHFHLHVIPRYKGDVEKPRGGVRNLKPPVVPYEED